MEEIAYGIYEGCIYEGGGIGGILYKDKNKAISEAKKVFKNKLKNDKKMYFKKNKEYKRHYDRYKWRKCDKQENRWHNTVDEIKVIEYKIK